MLTVFCLICLCASFLIAASAIVNLIVSLAKKGRKISLKKRSGITPFHLLVLGVFVAITLIFLPIYAKIYENDNIWVLIVKTPFLSAQNALQLFTINAGFDNIREVITTDNGLNPVLVDVYMIYATIYFVLAPALTAAFVLSFVKGLYENLRYLKDRYKQEIYIFSELNENSLALAKNIIATGKKNKGAKKDDQSQDVNEETDNAEAAKSTAQKKLRVKRTIVFTNVSRKLEEEKSELVAAAHDLGAICLQKDITDVYLPKKKSIYRKLYLISLDENENASKALQLISYCKQNCNYDTTHIYVFANTDESGILIDSVMPVLEQDKKKNTKPEEKFNIKVRRINEKSNLVWSTLRKSARELNITLPETEHNKSLDVNTPLIFSSATADADTNIKYIDVLIVGMGQYGTELLKTICWYCQMPNYRLRIHVFDGQEDCKNKVRSIAPEIVKYNNISAKREAQGEAYYKIRFCEKAIDVRQATFVDEIKKIGSVTLAFVTLGDDKTNIDTAIKLRRIFGKTYANKGYTIPPILTVVYDSEKTENLDSGRLLKHSNGEADYNIRFIGDIKTSYSLQNIEQAELEYNGLACHMQWAKVNYAPQTKLSEAKKEELQADWLDNERMYNIYEYNRRSSMAQAMHLMARKYLCAGCDNEQLKRNEHNRWNVFMRADGYTLSPKVHGARIRRDTVARIHKDLVPFNKLDKKEKAKDSVPDCDVLVKQYESGREKLFGSDKSAKR